MKSFNSGVVFLKTIDDPSVPEFPDHDTVEHLESPRLGLVLGRAEPEVPLAEARRRVAGVPAEIMEICRAGPFRSF